MDQTRGSHFTYGLVWLGFPQVPFGPPEITQVKLVEHVPCTHGPEQPCPNLTYPNIMDQSRGSHYNLWVSLTWVTPGALWATWGNPSPTIRTCPVYPWIRTTMPWPNLFQHNVSHTPKNHPKHESVSNMDQIVSFGLLGNMGQILSFGLLSNIDPTRGSHYTFSTLPKDRNWCMLPLPQLT